MPMHPHTTGADIGGDSEVRKPQILNVHVTEGRVYGRVELPAGEHGRRGVRQVQELLAPLRHFLERGKNSI